MKRQERDGRGKGSRWSETLPGLTHRGEYIPNGHFIYLTRLSNQRRYWIRVCFLDIFLLYNRRGFSRDFGCDARARLLLPNSLIEHTFVN